ncbi:hypothetical protein V5799_003096 [Amblyomma americanum]|uniref:Uncharacterized protein n=1 Tax=Amblyomma americanum TaxID=6943 RepID=A0AAQ4D9Y1_AMBAM
MTDQEILDRVVVPEDNSSSDSEGDSERDEPPISSTDAADMARRLKGYLEKLPTTKLLRCSEKKICERSAVGQAVSATWLPADTGLLVSRMLPRADCLWIASPVTSCR